jgi:hypothetical protein
MLSLKGISFFENLNLENAFTTNHNNLLHSYFDFNLNQKFTGLTSIFFQLLKQ